MSIRRRWTVENKWTCTSCGSENLGRHVSCQTCGNAKDGAEESAERVDMHAEVNDAALLKQAAEGAHWSCPFCDGKQRAPNGNCANCGGAKHQGPGLGGRTSRRDPNAPPRPGTTTRPATGRAPSPPSPTFVIDPASLRGPQHGGLWLAGGAVALVLFLVWFFMPRELDAKVNSMRWTHIAQYEARVIQTGTGWGTPSGAFNASCTSKYYGDERCNPRRCNPRTEYYDCNGYDCRCHNVCKSKKNGFSDCAEHCDTCYRRCDRTVYSTCYDQCPVYKNWCSYEYYAWVPRGTQTLSGASAANMLWPDLGPEDADHRLSKSPAYVVHFVTSDGDKYTHVPDTAAEFATFADDQTWVCEKAAVGFFKPLRRK